MVSTRTHGVQDDFACSVMTVNTAAEMTLLVDPQFGMYKQCLCVRQFQSWWKNGGSRG